MDYFIIFKSVRCVLIMTYMYVYQLYIVCESGNVWIFRNIIIERYNKTELYMIVLIHVLNLFNGQ